MVNKLIIYPVYNGFQIATIPVRFIIDFNGTILEHSYEPMCEDIKIYDVNFVLPPEVNVKGKLWALNRQTENYYYTLIPSTYPMCDKDVIEIYINGSGPSLAWSLSIR